MREVSQRLKYIRESENIRRKFQAKIHGLETKEPKKKMKHSNKLEDAVSRKINGRINLRNRDKSTA